LKRLLVLAIPSFQAPAIRNQKYISTAAYRPSQGGIGFISKSGMESVTGYQWTLQNTRADYASVTNYVSTLYLFLALILVTDWECN